MDPSDEKTGLAYHRARNDDGAATLYAADFAAGAQLGNYVVDALLSRGGFAAVYRAHHVILGRTVALKVLHRSLAQSPSVLRRFEQEAQAVNLIRHSNIVDVFEFGELDDGRPYMVMELLSGRDLDTYVKACGRLPVEELVGIFEPLCEAIAAAHAHGFIHRDVKTSNVFLADDGDRRRVVLLDFGIAKLVDPGGMSLTTSQNLLGTPSCMAPEQITGDAVDQRTDVYALGVLLFHVLTGELPFNEDSGTQMRYMHLHGPRPTPSLRLPSLARFDAVVHRAMRIDPRERYQSAGEFIAALRAAVSEAAAPCPRAAGIHVDVRTAPGTMDDPDDALLAEVDRLVALAQETLAAAGLRVAFQSGRQLLYARLLEGDELAIRRAAVAAALALRAAIDARPAPDARVHVNVCVHAAEVALAADEIAGGPLLCLGEWLIDADLPGVTATAATLDGLAAASEPLPDHPALVRVRQLGGERGEPRLPR